MVYYHCVVYTPFCGEEADVYIADTDYSYAEWKAHEAARENGMEWLDYERVDKEFDEDEYFDECGFKSMKQITEQEYEEAMRDGEWCV